MEKKIHYCWFGGKAKPRRVINCIKTWKKYLPDYEIIEWNEKNFDINASIFAKEAYESKKWAMVSDYVRIYALYNEGGIYFDTDMKVLKDISEITKKDMFMGYEYSGYVGTAVIGVKEKHNKYIKEILDYYNSLREFNPDIIYNYANPLIITKILKKYDSRVDENNITIVDDNVYIYPRDYFYPLNFDYSEKVYTKNTCMIHLFSATWTDKKDRRITNIYRRFGPNLGRKINNFINSINNINENTRFRIIGSLKKIKLKISIHVNIEKRVNKIKNALNEIHTDYIVICNQFSDYEKQNVIETFKGSILYVNKQYTKKEATKIVNEIISKNFKEVVFNSYLDGWDLLIEALSENRVKVKMILNYSNQDWNNEEIWYKYEKAIDLYNKRFICEFAIFNENEYEFYKGKDLKIKLLKKKMLINDSKSDNNDNKKTKEENSEIKFGIYGTTNTEIKNVYTQMAACNLIENSICDISPLKHQISMFARFNNININGIQKQLNLDEIIKRMNNNDVNLFATMFDENSILPIQSLEMGKMCIIGNCNYFKNTSLEKYLKVNNPNDYKEIKEKILFVLKNKELILKEYATWKKQYLNDVKKLKEDFIND